MMYKEKEQTLIASVFSADDWITIEATVVKIWENKHASMLQTGVVADHTGTMRFVNWAKSAAPIVEMGKTYIFKNVVTQKYKNKFSISFNYKSEIIELSADVE